MQVILFCPAHRGASGFPRVSESARAEFYQFGKVLKYDQNI